MILYEFPLAERIRSLLRLEDLYGRFESFSTRPAALEHHFSLYILFEILEIGARADLKSDLLQELERQRYTLENLRDNPRISAVALNQILEEIAITSTRLLKITGKFGQHIRDNEWLMGIKQRMNIPGGVCEFDQPSYHYWLRQPASARHRDLEQWAAPLLPIRDATNIVLRLLRDSSKSYKHVAKNGIFQQMSNGKLVQLLQIEVPKETQAVPELSANKYAINIRFTSVGHEGRPRTIDQDVTFDLGYCTL